MKLNKPTYCFYTGLFKTLTFGRIVNMLKSWAAFHISNLLSKPIVWGLPWAATIEPTTSCNLNCTQCPTGMGEITRPKGMLSTQNFITLLNSLEPHLQHLTLYLQGEPFLNRNFFDMVTTARKRNIFVFTSTNAHYITPQTAQNICLSGLNHIIISLDGTTQETYEIYRKGGQLNTVIQGISNLVNARTQLKLYHPYIEIQFIVFKHNQHQINDIKLLSRQLNIDRLTFKSAQIYTLERADELLPDKTSKIRYQKDDTGSWRLRKMPENRCKRLWTTSTFTWDGKMIACCYDKNAQFEFGLSETESTSNLWHSKRMNDFRKTILNRQHTIEICNNCGDRF